LARAYLFILLFEKEAVDSSQKSEGEGDSTSAPTSSLSHVVQ